MPAGTTIGSGLIIDGQPFFVPGTNRTCHWPLSSLRTAYPLSCNDSLFACQIAQNPGLTGPHFSWRGAHLGFDIVFTDQKHSSIAASTLSRYCAWPTSSLHRDCDFKCACLDAVAVTST